MLVVDDEEEVCLFLSGILKRKGCEVDTAADGQTAVDKASEFFFNLLITDLKMPKIDGMTVLKEVKKLNPYLEVIMVTGYPAAEKAAQAIKVGAYDFIAKFLAAARISETVEACLESQKISSGFIDNKELKALAEISRETVSYRDLALGMVKARRISFMVFDEKNR